MSPASRLTVLLFTDIVGSTHLKSKLGAVEYARLLELHNGLFEQICREFEGEILKHTGDGYFAAFSTGSQAVRAALRFQQGLRDLPEPRSIQVRIGIHVGEVAVTHMAGRADVVGVAADLAARVMSLAEAGQILLTRAVFNDARQFVSEHPPVEGHPLISLRWVAHGSYLFKGIDDPVEVFEVGADGAAPLSAPGGGIKGRRVVAHDQETTLGWRPAVGLEVPGRGGWTLERKLGEGGFGEVWLGQHKRTHQRRVFKFCFDADRLRSFKRELTLFRLLRETLGDRPDIAKLYEVKLDEEPYYLESEYTDGGNLIEWSDRKGGIKSVPLATRLQIVAQVADAVAAAHSAGVLHKDIKPSNILIHTEPGGRLQPRLADFGIGFLADRSQLAARNITEAGFTVMTQNDSSRTGTRLYAPPELLEGKPFTASGDIFALGVLLYQMVVGDLTRSLAIGWERNVSDTQLRAHIAACVDGEPERRLRDARELSARLRGEPGAALPTESVGWSEISEQPSTHAQMPSWWKWTMATCIALVVIVLAIAVLIRLPVPASWVPAPATPVAEATAPQIARTDKGALIELMEATNPRAAWKVQLDTEVVRSNAGSDLAVVFKIRADHDCHVVLLSQTSHGDVSILVPNSLLPLARVRTGHELRIPTAPEMEFPLSPPYGEDRFKVVAMTRAPEFANDRLTIDGEVLSSPEEMLKNDEWAVADARIVTDKDGKPVITE